MTVTPDELRSGQVLHVTEHANVQFKTRPILFRVIHVHKWNTYDGWIWLDGYELDGPKAVERRTIFVQPAGLRLVGDTVARRQQQVRATTNPGRYGNTVPQQRTPTKAVRRNR